jgi:hypothetical protein
MTIKPFSAINAFAPLRATVRLSRVDSTEPVRGTQILPLFLFDAFLAFFVLLAAVAHDDLLHSSVSAVAGV